MADNDNYTGDGPGGGGDGTERRRRRPAIVLQVTPARPDHHTQQLHVLMEKVHAAATETLGWADLEYYNSDLRSRFIIQGAMLASCYANLLKTTDRHIEAVRKRQDHARKPRP